MSTTQNKQPITRVKPVVSFLANLVSRITQIDANRDGRVQMLEALNALQVLAFEAFKDFYGFSVAELRLQVRDIDEAERAELVAVFKEKFILTNTEAELVIEAWLDWLSQGFGLFERTKALFDKTTPVVAA